jgi:hypothetical protein
MARIFSGLAALIAVALALPAQGREEDPVWQESWTCGGRIEITKRLLEGVSEDDELRGYGGDASLPPFLVLHLRYPELGVVIAVQQQSGWVGIPIEASNWLQGAYIVRRGGRARLFTMHSVEGPGHEYQILRTDDGFATVSCSTLDFPEEVEPPESHLQLIDFNADPSGRGALVGFAEDVWRDARARELREEYPNESFWYEYRTADGGHSWSPPVRSSRSLGRVMGTYSAVEQGASLRALYADLERSVSR